MSTVTGADGMTFSELVFSDLERCRPGERGWLRVIARCLTLPGLIASVVLRAQQCLWRSGHSTAASMLRSIGLILTGADLCPGMNVGPGLLIVHPNGVTMGFEGLTIGSNVSLAGGVVCAARYPDEREQEMATICDGAIIGAHAVLVGPVRIGNNAMVGANTVVLSDVADNAVVMGTPARQVGMRETATG